jgi:hypothetical protein
MFHVVVGVPEKVTNDEVRLDRPGVSETIHFLGDLAIGVL